MVRSNNHKHIKHTGKDENPASLLFDADFEITRLITLTSEAIYKVRQRELDTYKIHIRRSAIIRSIFLLGDNATPTTIARQLSRERHTIREQLVKMHQDNLINIINDLHKKNMIRVVLTKKGLAKYQQIQKAQSLKDIFSPLSQNDRKCIMKYLNIIRNEALKKIEQ